MDLRSLRVALRATWRRLHHLQGSLTSAVGHADATLSEYDRLKTTLPDALEKQQLAVATEGDGEAGEGGQVERRPSTGADKVEEAVKDPAEQKKRRRKSVAATRTMLGQAITDFSTQVWCVEKGVPLCLHSIHSQVVSVFLPCISYMHIKYS